MDNLNERIAGLQRRVNARVEELQAEKRLARCMGLLYFNLCARLYGDAPINPDSKLPVIGGVSGIKQLEADLAAAGIELGSEWEEFTPGELVAVVAAARRGARARRREIQRELSDAARARRSLRRLLPKQRPIAIVARGGMVGGGGSCKTPNCDHTFSMRGASPHAQKRKQEKNNKKAAKKAAKYRSY